MLKDYIKKYQDLVDYFLVDFNGEEIMIPSEDAEFYGDWFLELSVKYCGFNIERDICILILENEGE